MKTKHTILSERELNLLESLIASYGNIITFQNFYNNVKNALSKQGIYNLISKMKNNGWLIKIKKGIYALADLSTHNFVSISPLVVANILNSKSYVSFESALAYYGFFEQLLRTTTSVTITKPGLYSFQGFDYRFIKIKKELYSGFKEITVDGHIVNIAELERVFLDYLYFKNDTYSIDLLIEKLEKAKLKLDFEKLFNYAVEFPNATKRKIGFLLDIVNIDTVDLLKIISKKGYSRLTKNSTKFNAKWRLYYEDRFNQ